MGTTSTRWWKEKGCHELLLAAYRRVRNAPATEQRAKELLRALRMYEGRRCGGLGADEYCLTEEDDLDPKTINLCRSGVDTVHAEITQSKPRPMALTSGGDFAAREQAKMITKLAEAVLYDSKGDEEASQALKDCIAGGTGIAKIYEHDEKVRVCRVLPHQLFVDPIESYQGRPRTLYWSDLVDRDYLLERYPGKRELIEHATLIRTDEGNGFNAPAGPIGAETADVVEIIEAWRLPSTPTSKDGKYVVATNLGILHEEPWEDETFPFAFMPFGKPLLGFWGKGAGERLRGLQKRLDTIDDTIAKIQWLMANARVAVPKQAGINLAHLQSNELGAFYEYVHPYKPEVQTAPVVPAELYSERDWTIQKGFEELGVSQMQATSMKPSGLNSGVSLRYYADIQSKRFVDLAQAFQAFYVEIARQSIRCARRIAAKNKGFIISYAGKNKVEKIRVADLTIDDDSYILQVFPISMLPSTPAGKLAALQELLQAGTISQETFYRLADFPDLDSERELQTAPRDLVDKTLDYIMSTGDYVSPEPMQNLPMALAVSLLRYQRARIDGTTAEILDLLRRYMTDCEALIEDAKAKEAAQMQAAAPPVAGPPMAPPGVDPAAAAAPPPPPALPMENAA